MNTINRPFAAALRKLGFVREGRSDVFWCEVKRSSSGTVRVTTYTRRCSADPNTVVDVQLWSDGGHRASHMTNGIGNTVPSDFKTVEGMIKAISFEEQRDAEGVGRYGPENFD